MRHAFTRHGGTLGSTGAVAWQFERRGVVVVPADGVDEDELFFAAADAGAEDVEADGDVFQVTSAPENLAAVREAIEGAGFTVDSAELSMLPKTTVAVETSRQAKQLMRLIDTLEDNDDVQEVYANFDIPEQVLEAAPPRCRGERAGGRRLRSRRPCSRGRARSRARARGCARRGSARRSSGRRRPGGRGRSRCSSSPGGCSAAAG